MDQDEHRRWFSIPQNYPVAYWASRQGKTAERWGDHWGWLPPVNRPMNHRHSPCISPMNRCSIQGEMIGFNSFTVNQRFIGPAHGERLRIIGRIVGRIIGGRVGTLEFIWGRHPGRSNFLRICLVVTSYSHGKMCAKPQ